MSRHLPRTVFSAASEPARLRAFAASVVFGMLCRAALAHAPPGRPRQVIVKVLIHQAGHHPNGTTANSPREPTSRRACTVGRRIRSRQSQ